MDIAPVGLQMTYANANAATQVQHNLNHASALQQSFAAVEQERENELKQKQVRNKDDTEGGTIKDDPERRNRSLLSSVRETSTARRTTGRKICNGSETRTALGYFVLNS